MVNVANQMIGAYRTIIWNSGDLEFGCIGDGMAHEKSADATMLFNFLDHHTAESCGIYFSGDNLADELSGLTGPGAAGLRAYVSYTLVDPDHVAAGAGVSPYVVDAAGPVFPASHQAIAYGGML